MSNNQNRVETWNFEVGENDLTWPGWKKRRWRRRGGLPAQA